MEAARNAFTLPSEVIMKRRFLMAATAAVLLSSATAIAAELPTFEAIGFPITPVQISVLGAAHVQERSPVPTLMLGGMPASPVQIAVLTPRVKEVAAMTSPAKPEPSTH
jgi:hypothetical protein